MRLRFVLYHLEFSSLPLTAVPRDGTLSSAPSRPLGFYIYFPFRRSWTSVTPPPHPPRQPPPPPPSFFVKSLKKPPQTNPHPPVTMRRYLPPPLLIAFPLLFAHPQSHFFPLIVHLTVVIFLAHSTSGRVRQIWRLHKNARTLEFIHLDILHQRLCKTFRL